MSTSLKIYAVPKNAAPSQRAEIGKANSILHALATRTTAKLHLPDYMDGWSVDEILAEYAIAAEYNRKTLGEPTLAVTA